MVVAPNEEEGRGKEDDEEERSNVSRGMARGDASGEGSWVVVVLVVVDCVRQRDTADRASRFDFQRSDLGIWAGGWMTKPTLMDLDEANLWPEA